MKVLQSAEEVVSHIKDHTRILLGGFLAVGTAESFIDAALKSHISNLEVAVCDTAFPDKGVGKLIKARKVKKLFSSHIGTNLETGKQFNEGSLEIEFIPQGSLVERIRAAGAGLGAVITPVGLNTDAAAGKETITINDKQYLIELPLRGDVAWIKAHKADSYGNLVYYRAARNFNPVMATAADLVFVEVDELVDELDPEVIVTPGVLVDYVVCTS